MADQRFKVTYEQGGFFNAEGYQQIFVDQEIGVNYLLVMSGFGLSVTPLLNAEGQPVITSCNKE